MTLDLSLSASAGFRSLHRLVRNSLTSLATFGLPSVWSTRFPASCIHRGSRLARLLLLHPVLAVALTLPKSRSNIFPEKLEMFRIVCPQNMAATRCLQPQGQREALILMRSPPFQVNITIFPMLGHAAMQARKPTWRKPVCAGWIDAPNPPALRTSRAHYNELIHKIVNAFLPISKAFRLM